MLPWLPPALDYITDWLGHQMRVSEQAGCVIAIGHRGRLVLERAFGHADQLAGTKLTPRHRFRVASHSKSFTAAAMLKLRERGLLKLDDTAGQYVDGLHPEIAHATILQLLSHSAGIFRDGTDSSYWSEQAPFANAARIRADLRLPPAIPPNTRLKYSNHGFALAGLVIEAIAGEPYADFVTREIVRPAGLTETLPDVPLPRSAPLARGHSAKFPLGRRVIFPGEQSTHALAAATGFVSTAADLVRFFGQLAPNAPKSILSVASRREMARPQWRAAHSPVERGYGLGTISGQASGWEWFGHSGGFQGYLTRTATIPTQELTLSVLTNGTDGTPDAWLSGAIHILKTFAQGGRPTRRTVSWTGRWWSAWGVLDLVPVGNKVLVASPGMWLPFDHAMELDITGPDRGRIALANSFASHNEPVRRVRSKSGKATELWLASGRLLPEAAMTKDLLKRYG